MHHFSAKVRVATKHCHKFVVLRELTSVCNAVGEPFLEVGLAAAILSWIVNAFGLEVHACLAWLFSGTLIGMLELSEILENL